MTEEWHHLVTLVDALVASGNAVAGNGFTRNQGGWDCEMRYPLDFGVLGPLIEQDENDLRPDPARGRVDCLHCWAGIWGPT